MMKKILTIFIVGLIFFSLGYYAANLINQTKCGSLISGGITIPFSEQTSNLASLGIKNATGEVKEIRGNAITLIMDETAISQTSTSTEEKIVLTDSKTKVYKMVLKDQTAFQQEVDEFNKKTQDNSAGTSTQNQINQTDLQPPQPFDETLADFSDIKAGDKIGAMATVNIENLKEFTAIEIYIYPIMPKSYHP